jgi:hypothetical protein
MSASISLHAGGSKDFDGSSNDELVQTLKQLLYYVSICGIYYALNDILMS